MSNGFIGLGNMGGPMCRNLLSKSGSSVLVFDPNSAAVKGCVDAGAISCSSVAALAAESETIYLSLPTPRHVEDVITGESGILKNAKPGTLVVDFSTNSPTLAKSMAAALAESDIQYIEAPVTGGVPRAIDGSLTIMVGCSESLFERVLSQLTTMAGQVTRVGEVGSASAVKVINNMMFLCNLAAAAEGMSMAIKAGLDLNLFREIVRTGSGFSAGFRTIADKSLRNDFTPGFALGLACKDFEIATRLQSELQVPGFVAGAVMSVLRSAKGAGYGELDVGAVLKVYEFLGDLQPRID